MISNKLKITSFSQTCQLEMGRSSANAEAEC